MNNIYKVIWSKAKNCYVVASEIARSHTKSASGSEKIGGVARRSLLASLMALSLLCGGLGVAEATVHVVESGVTYEVLTTQEVTEELDKKVSKEVADLTYAKASDVATNTRDIATNKGNISELNGKLTNLTTVVSGKADVADVDNKLAKKADATSVFTKDEVNTKLADYAKSDDVYTKTVADGKFATSAALNTAKTDLEGEITTAKNELDGKIAANTTKITANEKAIQNLNAKAGNTETTLNNLSGHMTTAENNITDLKVADVRLEGKIDQNANDITGLKDKDGELSGKINDNKNLIDQNKTNITKNAADITNINEKLTTAEGNIQTNTANINALDKKVGTINNGTYLDGNASVADNLGKLDAGLKQEVTDRKTADDALSGRITANANTIAKVNQELVNTNNHFNTELRKTNDHFNTELRNTNAALQATNKRTAGIGRTDTGVEANNQTVIEDKVYFDQNGNVSGVKDLQTDTIHATGEITSKGLNAGDGEIKTTGKVSAGDVSTGTLETTDNATIGGNLDVNGKLNVGEIYMEHHKQESTGEKYDSATSITADGISNNAKVTDKNGVTTESKFTHDKEGSTTYAYQGDAANWKKSTSNVTADGVENVAEDSKGNNNTFTQTSTETKNTLTDKEGNTSTTRQDSKGIYGSAKDKDGNKSFTKQEGNRIAESVIGQDGKETKSEMTSTDITNTAKDGTITNTAKNVTNEGTESVTNKVGKNEVKVSKDGVNIKAEDGKKITESVGTASRVVENDKIIDEAGNSTVTTENGKGTTFGKDGSTDTTNIYGDSINTGTIKAKNTTTDKLTAGVAADADGGRLTVDADGVKGSYKFGDYTSKSYILPDTLKSGVDNGKEPTDAGFVGSRTDHYMDENKAKLDETVKDAAGSNVTNKTSTGTVTTIGDGNTTTKTEQGVKDITNTAKDGTIKNDANDIVNNAQETITNKAGTSITNQVNNSKVTTDASGTTFENKTAAVSDGGTTTTKINGNLINTGRVDANELGVSDVDGTNTADLSVKAGEGVKASAGNGTTKGSLDVTADEVKTEVKDSEGNHTNTSQTAKGINGYAKDKDGNKTYTKVTATENSFQIQDKNGEIKNHQVNTKDKSENTITNGDKENTVTSTADGTIFSNSKAAAPVTGASGAGDKVNTTIKGNTITTGKVTMDYAQVMKDLGVTGNANINGKTTTGSLEVNGESKLTGNVTMGSNATVEHDLTVKGTTNLSNTNVVGQLDVTGNATITGDVNAGSYSVGGKKYIDANGINANGQKITNVADGSISEGSKDAVNGGQLYGMKMDLEHKVDKVGANAAAMANLHPMEFDPDSKWNIAAAMGNYGSETATAIGAFYRPNEDVMVNFSTAFGTGENMVGGGVSVRLGKGSNKLSREESNALKDQVDDLTARMDALLSVLNPNMSKDFPDVPENHWAYEAVSRLAGNDIVQGYPDGEFHGERTMTRYEMAEIIYNALSRGAEAERELVEEFKPELQAMAASEKATAEKAEG